MNTAKQYGSVQGPILSTLKFIKPFEAEGKGVWKKWLITHLKNKSGIYLIKKEKDHKIVFSGMAFLCLYNCIRSFFKKRREDHDSYEVTFYECSKKNIKQIYEFILREVSLLPLNDVYEKIRPYLEQHEDVPLDLLVFQPPFEGKRKSRAASTFPRKDYKRCAGVYVIIENDIVVYVGKSDGHLWQRSYQHFWSHKPDPRGPHYYVEFSQTLDVHDYKMALIQIPGLNKNFEQIKDFKQITKEVLELENYLTYQFRATVLNKKIIEEKPVIQPIESDFGDLIPTPDEDIPF